MSPSDTGEAHRVVCTLDEVLRGRGMTLTELSDRVGVTIANLSILKNNRAKAIRFSTLTAICEALECDVVDVFRIRDEPAV